MTRRRTGKAWWVLARPANWPTVASNVLSSTALAGGTHPAVARPHMDLPGNSPPHPAGVVPDPAELVVLTGTHSAWTVVAMLLAGLMIYTGGVIGNDAADAGVDAVERPSRPVPSGEVSRTAAAAVAGLLLLGGAGLGFVFGGGAAGWSHGLWWWVLAAAVVAYNATHQRWPGAVGMIAGCRTFLCLAAGAAFGLGVVSWWHAGAVGAAVLGISVYAREEVRLDRAPRVGTLLGCLPFIDAAFCLVVGASMTAAGCVALSACSLMLQRRLPGS